MTHNGPSLEDKLIALLADYDEALAAGDTPADEASSADLPSLQRDQAYLQLLRQALRPGVQTKAPEAAALLSSVTGREQGHLGVELPKTLGRFEIVRELGQGGFGVVLLAWDPLLSRDVALKVPRAEALLTPAFRERFHKEARAAASLDHPNVVPVHEVGEAGPLCFIVSAYCPGISLSGWLQQSAEPVPFDQAASLCVTLAGAIQHAHDRGIVHRDLKPSNILLTSAENEQASGGRKPPVPATGGLRPPLAVLIPRITDFGLAKLLGEESGVEQTQSGAILGTPRYMAPEQAAGKAKEVGPAADIYALGVILYELLTGRTPFIGETNLEILLQAQSDEPVSPSRLRPKVPRDLETICLKCLQKESGKRYLSAQELAEDLGRYLGGEPIRARPAGLGTRAWKWARRRPALTAFLILLALVTVVGFPALTLLWLRAEEEATRAETAQGQAETAQGQAETAQKAEKKRADEAEKATKSKEAAWEKEKEARVIAEKRLQEKRASEANSLFQLAHNRWVATQFEQAHDLLQKCPRDLRGWEWHYLKRLCEQRRVLCRGHQQQIWGVAFSADGRWVASASFDQTVKVWDAATGQEKFTFRGHANIARTVAFSPDSKWLASAGDDGNARVWDLTSGHELLTLRGHGSQVHGLAFNGNGKVLATAGRDGTVRLWDAGTGQQTRILTDRALSSWSVSFSPDGQRVAAVVGDRDNRKEPMEVKVWNVATGKEVLSLKGREGAELGIVIFSPDGKHLALGNVGEVRICHAGTGELVRTITRFARTLAFSPDGRLLASADDKSVEVRDLVTDKVTFTCQGEQSVAFSPDGKRLVVASPDRDVQVWDMVPEMRPFSLQGHTGLVNAVVFSRDGRFLASVSSDKSLKVWDVATRRVVLTREDPEQQLFDTAFSADSKRVATRIGGKIKAWDVASGRVDESAMDDGTWNWSGRTIHSADGKRVASKGVDREGNPEWAVTVKDVATGRQLFRYKYSIAFYSGDMIILSPDGRYVAAAGPNGWLMIGDVEEGRLLKQFRGHGSAIHSLVFSPDGRRVVTTRRASHWIEPSEMKLWDVRTGQELLAFSAPNYPVTGVAFSPDGRLLAAASWDGSIKLWDSEPAPELFAVKADSRLLAFVGPDSGVLAAAGDRTLRLWDVKTAEERDGFGGPRQPLAFTPDGHVLLGHTAGQIELRDMIKGQVLAAPSDPMSVGAWAVSADSKTFAIVGEELSVRPRLPPRGPGGRPPFPPPGPPVPRPEPGLIRLWDASTGREHKPFPRRIGYVSCLALSPDGRKIAAPDSHDRSAVKLWDVATGEEFAVLKGHTGSVCALAFSPDRKHLAVVAGGIPQTSGEVVLWEVDRTSGKKPGRRHTTLKGLPGWARAIAFSPGGQILATSGTGGVRLWSVETGKELLALAGAEGNLAFSSDGRMLATGGGNGVKVWDVSSTQDAGRPSKGR
jgi:WD40 repeat protein